MFVDTIKSFRFWCQLVLPLVYDDSLSYYEVLCKLTDYVNNLTKDVQQITKILEQYGLTLDELKSDVNELQRELEKVKNGEYVSLYLDSIKAWIDNNLQNLVRNIVKYVVFGLSSDGYFVGYIPESWDFIRFDTIADITNDLYGHLILEW